MGRRKRKLDVKYYENIDQMGKLVILEAPIKAWMDKFGICQNTAIKWRKTFIAQTNLDDIRKEEVKKEFYAVAKEVMKISKRSFLNAYTKAKNTRDEASVVRSSSDLLKIHMDVYSRLGILPKDGLEITGKVDLGDVFNKILIQDKDIKKTDNILKKIEKR
jgi:hypothetical protein